MPKPEDDDDRRPKRDGFPRRGGGGRGRFGRRDDRRVERGPRKFDRSDDRGPRKSDGRDDRSPRRDDRGPRKFDRSGDRRPRKFDRRDDRGPRRDDRGPRRDDRGPRKFDRRDDRRPRRDDRPDSRGPRKFDRRDDRGPRKFDRRDDRRPRRDDVPQTEAQRRRAEVFAKKGPRKYGVDKPYAPRQDDTEKTVDEGSTRRQRFDRDGRPRGDERGSRRDKPRHARRDSAESPFPTTSPLDEALSREVKRAVGDRRFGFVAKQLAKSLSAYDAERYREAMKILQPILEDLWLVAEVRVLAGRLEYKLERWRSAAEHLEFARGGDPTDMTNMAVLIDCYRALKRYEIVDQLWSEVKESSPHPALMAEARVAAAGAYADRGDLQTAIRMMTHGGEPRQVQEYHLLEWYVLGDLYDRAGDPVTAKRMFVKVAQHSPNYFDVQARLAGLGE